MAKNNSIPELNSLMKEVERTFRHRLVTTNNFELLSMVIQHDLNETVSASTLKRIWGYVNLNPVPRVSTLDILARYVGKGSFAEYCESLKRMPSFESAFFTAKQVEVKDLVPGDVVEVGWEPNRLVRLKYEGSSEFTVIESLNSKLQAGDRFSTEYFMIGEPLLLPHIIRDGVQTEPFVAGRSKGLTSLKVE